MWWIIILVIAVFAYLYSKGQSDKKQQELTSEIVEVSSSVVEHKERKVLQELSSVVVTSEATTKPGAPVIFELIDFMTPRLKVDMRVVEGTNRLVVWDSPRVNLLRQRFNVKNVLQQLEFRDGDQTIEVYRALADDRVVTFVFPRENDNTDIIPLLPRSTSDDPSETPSRNKTKGVLDVTKAEPENVPSDLLPMIRDLQSSYAARQASSGPKAVDTHRS